MSTRRSRSRSTPTPPIGAPSLEPLLREADRLQGQGTLLWLLGAGIQHALRSGTAPSSNGAPAPLDLKEWAEEAMRALDGARPGSRVDGAVAVRPSPVQQTVVQPAGAAPDPEPPQPGSILVVWLGSDVIQGDWMSVAVGADGEGRKHLLAVREGAATDPAVVERVLEDLVDRGVSPEKGLLLVTEGSRTLDERLVPFWGPGALVAHCRRRVLQDVLEHLPEGSRPQVRRELERAWLDDPDEAAGRLTRASEGLRRSHPGAAERLERSVEPCLTVARLGIPRPLRDHLEVAGVARMALLQGRRGGAGIEGLTRGVQSWQRRTKRLIGHRDLPALGQALTAHGGIDPS